MRAGRAMCRRSRLAEWSWAAGLPEITGVGSAGLSNEILIFSALSQSTKWRSHFVLLKPLLGLFFNSQKFRHTFVNWYKNWFFESQPAADFQKTNLGVS